MPGLERGLQHVPKLVLIFRSHADHVWEEAQIRHVVNAVMGRAVGAGDAAAVEREDHRQIHDGHVVKNLIERSLEERRVDRRDRLHPLRGHAAAERHGMLLGNADVEHPGGMSFPELVEPRAVGHRRGDGDNLRVAFGELDQRFGEDGRVARRPGLARLHHLA